MMQKNQSMTQLNHKMFIFGAMLYSANQLETLLERQLKIYDITVKQWFLMVTLDTFFDGKTTITLLAQAMGTSHQNVKQISLKLKDKGYITLNKDVKDQRVTCLMLNTLFYEKNVSLDDEMSTFMNQVFKDIPEDDQAMFRTYMLHMMKNLIDMSHTI